MSDVFFAPGRTELAGNHTDHQKGRVIAAAVDTGLTAHCTKNNDNVIRIRSEGFGEDEIRLRYLEVKPEEGFYAKKGTVKAVVYDGLNQTTIIGKKNSDGKTYSFEIPEKVSPAAASSSLISLFTS